MGDGNNAGLADQRVIGEVGNIPGDLAAFQCGEDIGVIHQTAPGQIDDADAIAHGGDGSLVDHPLGGGEQRRVNGDIVAHLIDGLQIHHLNGGIQHQCILNREIGVIAVDIHAQLDGGIGHLDAHCAQADDAQIFTHDLGAYKFALALFHQLFHIAVGIRKAGHPLNAAHDIPGGQHQGTDHQLFYGVGVGTGGVEDHNTGLGALIQRDVVGARTGPGNGPEVGAELHLMHIRRANQNAIGVFAGVGYGKFLLVQLAQTQRTDFIERLNGIHNIDPLIIRSLCRTS